MSKFKGVITDNAQNGMKLKIRNDAYNFMINETEINILEIFAGSGRNYKNIWYKAHDYLGIDKKKYHDNRTMIYGDAELILKKINIEKFNSFDIDAYGSPYECLEIILNSIEKNHQFLMFCITDGLDIDLRMGNVKKSFAKLAGIDTNNLKNAHFLHEYLIQQVTKTIESKIAYKNIFFELCKGKTGSGMFYYAAIFKKID